MRRDGAAVSVIAGMRGFMNFPEFRQQIMGYGHGRAPGDGTIALSAPRSFGKVHGSSVFPGIRAVVANGDGRARRCT
jgi:hypothetical protein